MSTAAALAKAALLLITDEKTRKKVGWVLVAILSPVILIIALICSIFSGGASHNNATVAACFYGSSYSDQVPAEFRTHVAQMQTAFSRLDSAVASVNAQMEDGNGLDPTRVKAVFYRESFSFGKRCRVPPCCPVVERLSSAGKELSLTIWKPVLQCRTAYR